MKIYIFIFSRNNSTVFETSGPDFMKRKSSGTTQTRTSFSFSYLANHTFSLVEGNEIKDL